MTLSNAIDGVALFDRPRREQHASLARHEPIEEPGIVLMVAILRRGPREDVGRDRQLVKRIGARAAFALEVRGVGEDEHEVMVAVRVRLSRGTAPEQQYQLGTRHARQLVPCVAPGSQRTES